MDQLRQPLLDAPVIEKEDYEYFVHPISDGIPTLEPGLLHEIIIEVIRKVNLGNVDKIVTPTMMDVHIPAAVSLMTDIPPVIIHEYEYDLDDKVSLRQQTGYSEGNTFISNVSGGDHMLVLDDMLSTGGTMKAVLDALDHIGMDIVDTVAIIKKAGPSELDDSDHHVEMLINVTIEDGEVAIVSEHGDD